MLAMLFEMVERGAVEEIMLCFGAVGYSLVLGYRIGVADVGIVARVRMRLSGCVVGRHRMGNCVPRTKESFR